MPKRKLLIGAHMSTSGGVRNAPVRGHEVGCACIQIFTKSNMQWAAKPLDPEDVAEFHRNCEELDIAPVMAHDSYLINLCATDPALAKKSFDSFLMEMERCDQLKLPGLIMHPGSHTGAGEEAGMRDVIAAVNGLIAKTPDSTVRILFETTAGQGSNLGYTFEQIAQLVDGAKEKQRVGVCLDTCHVFAAGYDIRTQRGYKQVMGEFDKLIGIKNLRAFHFNDAKGDLGSKLDRHEHIGHGKLGDDAFRFILRDPRFDEVPKLLETPKGKKGKQEWDVINLTTLRRLAGK
jgi:deoxyribonuclease-4